MENAVERIELLKKVIEIDGAEKVFEDLIDYLSEDESFETFINAVLETYTEEGAKAIVNDLYDEEVVDHLLERKRSRGDFMPAYHL